MINLFLKPINPISVFNVFNCINVFRNQRKLFFTKLSITLNEKHSFDFLKKILIHSYVIICLYSKKKKNDDFQGHWCRLFFLFLYVLPYDALISLLYAFQICTAFDAPAEVTRDDRRKRNNIEFCSINDFLY